MPGSVKIESAGNTANPVYIHADKLVYVEGESEIFGEGNVVVRHEDITIFGDLVYINTKEGDISAEGNVLAARASGLRIYTDKLYYNTKDKSAYTKKANVLSLPWIARAEEVRQQGDKVELEKPVFTTCDAVKPHYRMEAAMITLHGRRKLEAWHIRFYLGMVPVFYFPYFYQNLEANKDPFDIKFGHNDHMGWYVYLKYFLFLNPLEGLVTQGYVGYDFREKIGPGFSTDMSYSLWDRGSGNVKSSYFEDRKIDKRRWSLAYSHEQRFGDRTRAGIRVNSSSDSALNRDFLSIEEVDMFRHEYSASFSTFQGRHSLGATVSDIQQLDTETKKYFTASRVLPSATYSMTSMQLIPFLYYNHAMMLNRTYNRQGDHYSDAGTLGPRLTLNSPKLPVVAVSGNAGLNVSWKKENEKDEGWGDVVNSLNTSENLRISILPSNHLDAVFTHSYAKQLNKFDGDGITGNNLNARLNGGYGTFNFSASTNYNLLAKRETLLNGSDLDRFSLLGFNANFSHNYYYLSASGSYGMPANQIKNLTFNFRVSDPGQGKLWSIGAYTSFINNLLDFRGHPQSGVEDSTTFGTTIGFNFWEDFNISMTRSYDMQQKILTSHAYNIRWHIHCWEAALSWSKNNSNAEQIFFSIYLSAAPQFKFDKPASPTAPVFDTLLNTMVNP